MSVANFIPEIWSAKLLTSLKKSLVYGGLANRDYEGEISEAGDTVRITNVGRPTIGTYVPNVTTITPETVTTAQRTLLIDQSKYFAFEIDDVDKRQAKDGVMAESMQEASYALRDTADQYLAGLYTGVQAANALGTVAVAAASPTAAYDSVLVPLKVALDDAQVPTEGRWVVIPPWFHGRLLRDDRFIRADASGKPAASINGKVGDAAGFTIHVSSNTPNPAGDDNIVMAGHKMAITYAEQINKVEAYRPESSFADAVKGLHLYGAKLVRPDAIATCQASQT